MKITIMGKITSLTGGMLILLIAVMAVYQASIIFSTNEFKTLIDSEIKIANRAQLVKNMMMESIKHEKQFLLQPDTKFVQELNEHTSRLLKETQEIQQAALGMGLTAEAKKAGEIITLANDYLTAFTDIVNAATAKGFTQESGLQGEFSAIAVSLAGKMQKYQVDDLYIALLQVRRYEKDYISTESDKDKTYLLENIARYKKLLDQSRAEESAVAVQKKALTQYDEILQKYIAKAEGTAGGSKKILYRKMRMRARKMESAVADIYVPRSLELLLDIRKNEKDYLLTKDAKYIDKVHASIAMLKDVFKGSGILEEYTGIVEKELAAYKNAFDDLTAKDVEIENLMVTMGKTTQEITVQVEGIVKSANESSNSKIKSTVSRTKKYSYVAVGVGGLAFIIGIFSAFFITRSITKPIKETVEMLEDIAEGEGDLTKRLKAMTRDEIGDMAGLFNVFVEKLHGIIWKISQNIDTLALFSNELSNFSEHMATASNEVSFSSNNVASATEEMSSNLLSVSTTMGQASSNIEIMAASIEEMTSTVNEIAKSTDNARNMSEDAVTQVEKVSNRVGVLDDSAQDIGKVTETITEISEQTNLLALNATIEAARAGEAGKGFAVVAVEIKELAKKTSEATLVIKEKIEGIQDISRETTSNIMQISSVISDVNEVVTMIASTVEEQAATIREIAGNIAQVNDGVKDVNDNMAQSTQVSQNIAKDISEVNISMDGVSKSGSKLRSESEELAKLAGNLNDLVGTFKIDKA